jgi:hypothetical protein
MEAKVSTQDPGRRAWRRPSVRALVTVGAALALAWGIDPVSSARPVAQSTQPPAPRLHDSHLHVTNYVQEGTTLRELLKVMGDRVGRAAVFGLPLQQMWDYGNTGGFAPTYYLHTDAPLYYYSFTDAWLAMQYKSLTPAEQARFDPMIIGFNPADMYATDHIRRVLLTFPGVFTGIGEFSIHKEFVSAKIPGKTASLLDPALDRLFDFCAETGLVAILHSDIDVPFPKPGQDPYMVVQMRDLLQRHPNVNIIWAHAGLGRVVHPVKDQLSFMERGLANPALRGFYVDISWDEMAKYVVASPETIQATADLINKYPDRWLFGSDEVAPTEQQKYLKTYDIYAPLLGRLTPDARHKLLAGNYERLFDEARRRVRAWEKAHGR